MNKILNKLEEHNFLELYKNEQDPKVRIRFLGLQHKKEGLKFTQIARMLKKSRYAIMDWCNWFVEYGIDGLYDDQRSGRTPFLAKEDEKKFVQSLEKLQEEKEGGRTTGEDIRLLLRERFNARYSLNGVYDLLKRLNIVWITGRSIHPKADQEKQEEFKKKLSRVNKKMSSHRHSTR